MLKSYKRERGSTEVWKVLCTILDFIKVDGIKKKAFLTINIITINLCVIRPMVR